MSMKLRGQPATALIGATLLANALVVPSTLQAATGERRAPVGWRRVASPNPSDQGTT